MKGTPIYKRIHLHMIVTSFQNSKSLFKKTHSMHTFHLLFDNSMVRQCNKQENTYKMKKNKKNNGTETK